MNRRAFTLSALWTVLAGLLTRPAQAAETGKRYYMVRQGVYYYTVFAKNTEDAYKKANAKLGVPDLFVSAEHFVLHHCEGCNHSAFWNTAFDRLYQAPYNVQSPQETFTFYCVAPSTSDSHKLAIKALEKSIKDVQHVYLVGVYRGEIR